VKDTSDDSTLVVYEDEIQGDADAEDESVETVERTERDSNGRKRKIIKRIHHKKAKRSTTTTTESSSNGG
jgi:helix-turn-helix protein